MEKKIISTELLPEECKELFKKFIIIDKDIKEQDLQEAIALMTWPGLITKELLDKMKNLKIIQTFSAGVDDLNFSIIPRNIIILSNAGAYSIPVAEHAWAIALALAKGVGLKKKIKVKKITNSKILILGCGGIGSEIARIGKLAFNTYNIGVSRSFQKPELFDEKYSELQILNSIIPKVDIIFNTLPLNKYTKSILNYDNLKYCKNNSIIVNVGRGETVDENGIYRLLKERPDIRFGTDVFWRRNGIEDFNTKLWELENFTGTLHTAGAYGSEEVRKDAIISACKNLAMYLNEGKIRNLVKFEDYI
ncbi:MAG: NAD(P)-dependent oxidoreductase [Sulfolobaceae archaeon]